LQTTDASGRVTFNTIYPGWYMGRATHIHVQVFVNGVAVKTTQVAFPEDITREVYAQGVYASKGQNTTSNNGDMVFSDGTSTEMASVSGSPAAGYTAVLTIVVSA
jgi:protocatechuate 3,4-dioxygenase beta subunit